MPVRTHYEVTMPPPWRALPGILAGLLDHTQYEFSLTGPMGVVEITGLATVDPAAWTGGERSLRDCLFDSAQRAIAEVERAGYRHEDHPEIHIIGEIAAPFGRPAELIRTKCVVEMRLIAPWTEALP